VTRKTKIVKTKAELLDALQNAVVGELIYVDDDSVINLGSSVNIDIKAGVTLASARGKNGSLGAKIMTTYKGAKYSLFKIRGDSVRITGLRISGPDTDQDGDINQIEIGINISSDSSVTYYKTIIDNNEIFGWQKVGVSIDNVKDVVVKSNHIHHNLYIDSESSSKFGYGIEIADTGSAVIENNLFDHNRHDIACNGNPKSSYAARYNLVLNGGISHNFDVHAWREKYGDSLKPDGSEYAGYAFYFEHNTFLTSNPAYMRLWWKTPDIYIRGNTDSAVVIKNNIFRKSEGHAIKHSTNGASYAPTFGDNIPGFFKLSGNSFDVDYPPAIFVSYSGSTFWTFRRFEHNQSFVVGDFAGDNRDDLFYADGNNWFVSESAKNEWQKINSSQIKTADLRFYDFDGDGITDVFRTNGEHWYIATNGGKNDWAKWRDSQVSLSKLRFGDFDGDKKTDIFWSDGNTGKWKISKGGKLGWTILNTSQVSVSDLGFGDFNGDGKTDVFWQHDGKWQVSWSGQSKWQVINTSDISVNNLRFGDFNGDGKTDVFRTDGNRWYISWNGQTKWQMLNSSSYDLNQLIFGDFNGDGKTDVAVIDKFW
jgi:hypothetical protein